MSNIVAVQKLLFLNELYEVEKTMMVFCSLLMDLVAVGPRLDHPPDSALALNPLNCGSQLWSADL